MEAPKLLTKEVEEHFSEVQDYRIRDRLEEGDYYHSYDPALLEFIRQNLPKESRILEVGGGSGFKLDLIERKSGIHELYNCELVPGVYKRQSSVNIRLVGGNALSLPFREASFDGVITVNLLHHLVGKNIDETRKNQALAISEMSRVLRKNGFLVIGEIIHTSRTVSSLVFVICRALSNMNMSVKALGLRNRVIVSFLTEKELITHIDGITGNSRVITEILRLYKAPKFNIVRAITWSLERNAFIISKKT